jgi:hypothetical protein
MTAKPTATLATSRRIAVRVATMAARTASSTTASEATTGVIRTVVRAHWARTRSSLR